VKAHCCHGVDRVPGPEARDVPQHDDNDALHACGRQQILAKEVQPAGPAHKEAALNSLTALLRSGLTVTDS
jgi:hypothetical protein